MMNGFVRWLKFSFVGIIGVGVQLSVLFALSSAGHLNYLISTVLAVESAVAHNFIWHQRFTWRDRGRTQIWQTLARLLRFNLGNGAISLVGNVVLMRFLVGQAHLRVMPANLISIAICALANFLVSDRWVFLEVEPLPTRWDRLRRGMLVSHEQESALGERDVDQGSAGSKGEPDADLGSKQKRREGPELVQGKAEHEYFSELGQQVFNFECDSGQQIQTHGNADQS